MPGFQHGGHSCDFWLIHFFLVFLHHSDQIRVLCKNIHTFLPPPPVSAALLPSPKCFTDCCSVHMTQCVHDMTQCVLAPPVNHAFPVTRQNTRLLAAVHTFPWHAIHDMGMNVSERFPIGITRKHLRVIIQRILSGKIPNLEWQMDDLACKLLLLSGKCFIEFLMSGRASASRGNCCPLWCKMGKKWPQNGPPLNFGVRSSKFTENREIVVQNWDFVHWVKHFNVEKNAQINCLEN